MLEHQFFLPVCDCKGYIWQEVQALKVIVCLSNFLAFLYGGSLPFSKLAGSPEAGESLKKVCFSLFLFLGPRVGLTKSAAVRRRFHKVGWVLSLFLEGQNLVLWRPWLHSAIAAATKTVSVIREGVPFFHKFPDNVPSLSLPTLWGNFLLLGVISQTFPLKWNGTLKISENWSIFSPGKGQFWPRFRDISQRRDSFQLGVFFFLLSVQIFRVIWAASINWQRRKREFFFETEIWRVEKKKVKRFPRSSKKRACARVSEFLETDFEWDRTKIWTK